MLALLAGEVGCREDARSPQASFPTPLDSEARLRGSRAFFAELSRSNGQN